MTANSKNRWGPGLVLVFVLFVVVMLGITGFLMMQDVNLVTDSYYDKELQYQARIQAIERTRALGASAGLERTADGLLLQFPGGVPRMELTGTVTLYRPADHAADRTLPVAPDSLWQQFIPTTSLASGLWRCQVHWTMRQEEYYFEQPFMVP
jgi:nitrogen fixation protein FixH